MPFNAGAAKEDLQRQINKMKAEFQSRADKEHADLKKAISSSCILVENTAKLKMKNATVDYTKAVKRGKGRYHFPSVPGSAPAPDSGHMMRTVTHDIQEDENGIIGRVGSTQLEPPYPAYLEEGTTEIAPRPWLLPSLNEKKEEIMAKLNKVTRGGSAVMGEISDDASE